MGGHQSVRPGLFTHLTVRAAHRAGAVLLAALAAWSADAIAGEGTLDARLVHRQVRDDVVVPRTFSGAGIALGGGWRQDGRVHSGGAHLGVPFVVLANRHGHLGATWSVDVDGHWDAVVAGVFGGTFAVGAGLHGDVDVYFHAQWDDSHVYWLTQWGLGPRAVWRRPYGDRAVEVWTSLPLVVIGSRPPPRWETKVENIVSPLFQFSRAHSEARVTSLHRAVDWHGGVDWTKPLSRGALALGLECRVAMATWPERVTSLSVAAVFERRLGRKP